MEKIKVISAITLLSSLLCACASSVTTGPIPGQGLNVEQIYNSVIEGNMTGNSSTFRQKASLQKPNYEGYTRTALNETKAQFRPMENPTIPIYVYPHIVQVGDEQLVKPGYTTEFFLLKRNQFALNSERY